MVLEVSVRIVLRSMTSSTRTQHEIQTSPSVKTSATATAQLDYISLYRSADIYGLLLL